MSEFKTEEEIFADKIIENTIQAWIKKGVIKKSCKNLDIKKKNRLVNEYILKGEKIVFDDEAIEYYIKIYIKNGTFDESCKDLNIEEKRRLIDEHTAEEHRKSEARIKMRKEDEEINKLVKEFQKGSEWEGSDTNYIPMEKHYLFKQELERIEYDRKIRQENEKNGISNKPPEIIWKEFYKDKSPKERYYLLKEELDKLIAETNERRRKKRESIEKEEQEINFRLKMMDREGVWYGPPPGDEERAIAERSAYHKAEKEFEIKRTGIIAEMESLIQAGKLIKKPTNNNLQ